MKKKVIIALLAIAVVVIGVFAVSKIKTTNPNTGLETVKDDQGDQKEFDDFTLKVNDMEFKIPQNANVLTEKGINIAGEQVDKNSTAKKTVNIDGTGLTVFLHNFTDEAAASENCTFAGFAAETDGIGTVKGALIGKSEKADVVSIYGKNYSDIARDSGYTGFEYADNDGNVARFLFDKNNVLKEIVMLNLTDPETEKTTSEETSDNAGESATSNTDESSYVDVIEPSSVDEYEFPETLSGTFDAPEIQLYDGGLIYKFPMPVRDLLSLGWVTVDDISYLDAGQDSSIELSDGDNRITVDIHNPENAPVSELDSWITTITFGENGVPGSDITVNGKVKLGISEEELLTQMSDSGLEKKEIPTNEGKYISYYTSDEKTYYRFEIKDGKVIAVTLDHVM